MSNSSNNGRSVENGLSGGKISSWTPAATAASTKTNNENLSTIAPKDNSSVACPHLEQLMFPKFLSLNCNQLDGFCMGRVNDASNPGRLYIEALHLKDFLKDTDTLTKEYNKKGRNKRASPSRPPSKKKSRGSDAKDVADDKALSQAVWGGMEGKRTWILSSSDRGIEGMYSSMIPYEGDLEKKLLLLDKESSGEALDILLNSELKLRTLQKSLHLHDKTTMFDNYVCNSDDALPPQDDEIKVLKDLAKPLPNTQPHTLQNTNSQGAAAANETGVEKSAKTVKEPVVSEQTAIDQPMETDEKVDEAVSPEKMTTEDIVSTDQAGAGKTKSASASEEPTTLHSTENSTTIESKDKAAEVLSPETAGSNETKIGLGQVSSGAGTATATTPSAEKAQNQLSVTSTSGLKQSDSLVAPNVTEKQQPLQNEIEAEETAESLHGRALYEGKDASFAANKMLSSFRQNRRKFWNVSNNSEMKCVWCSSSNEACTKSTKKYPLREFGVIKDACISTKGDHLSHASGDNLIQCLECDLIGCRSGFVGGKGHAMLHFLMSGHTYGVTCGEAGEIFCMRCGDLVQQECFDRERERVFLEQNHPSFCWQESPISRGINPSSFTVTKEQGYVWRGLLASYPIPATPQFVRAGRFALKRALMFRGCSSSKMITLGPNALKVTIQRQAHTNNRLIPTPVGLYNLGNTCYMNSTLQCLINCAPLQEAFLKNLTHPYQCCLTLKAGETSCLACEIDRLFLEYFGSCVGIDTIAALEEEALDANLTATNEHSPEKCGHPVIPSNFLAKVWKHSTVRHLARHDQHDAQEFYHAFIDGLDTDVLSSQKTLRGVQQAIKYKSQIRSDPSPVTPPQSSIKDLFGGSLRSVLICDQCGCKRSQIESFLNLSLPLKNDNINACLKHFTDPETLSDPIYCPSCNKKTNTLKQHTFAKLPRVLCLHLKRFDAANNKKISDFVSYPASDLDMGKYLPHWCERGLSKESKDRDSNQLDVESPKVLYDLFATVNHRGTLNQGHYTSNVKCDNHWYHCNDAFVCDAGEGNGEKEVLAAEGAYMLFYQRKDGK